MRDSAQGATAQAQAQKAAHEILEPHVLISVIADREFLTGSVNGAAQIQAGGIDTQIDVSHECAQENDAIASLDVLPDIVAAHRAFIDAEVKGMLLADNGFAQDGGGNWDVGFPGELEHRILQAEPVDFNVGNDHRPAGGVDHELGLCECGTQAPGIAALVNFESLVRRVARHEDQVARQFEIHGPLEPQGSVQDTVNLLEGGLRIAQDGRGDGELFEDLFLGVKFADFVVEQRVLFALLHAGSATYYHDGRFFGKGLGGRVGDLEAADTVSNTNCAKSADSRVCVGGKSGALLVAGVNDAQLALGEQIVKSQDIVAGNAEDVADAVRVESSDKVLANGERLFHLAREHDNTLR